MAIARASLWRSPELARASPIPSLGIAIAKARRSSLAIAGDELAYRRPKKAVPAAAPHSQTIDNVAGLLHAAIYYITFSTQHMRCRSNYLAMSLLYTTSTSKLHTSSDALEDGLPLSGPNKGRALPHKRACHTHTHTHAFLYPPPPPSGELAQHRDAPLHPLGGGVLGWQNDAHDEVVLLAVPFQAVALGGAVDGAQVRHYPPSRPRLTLQAHRPLLQYPTWRYPTRFSGSTDMAGECQPRRQPKIANWRNRYNHELANLEKIS